MLRKKILILGDEQVLGLASKLLESRKNKWNNHYAPFAFVKPNASSLEILNHCIKIKKDVSINDYVVISIGSHDQNPNVLLSRICIMLHELQGTNVILLPVNNNRYLNEKKLNTCIKQLSTTFLNCTFIDGKMFYQDQKTFLEFMCLKINVAIDFPVYESCFLKRIARNTLASPKKKPETSIEKSYDPPRKGTIPYYFTTVANKHLNSPIKLNSSKSDKTNSSIFFRT